ncbi:hypothetical protein VTI74DRAFT_1819 [Chaetomium olivicolor]
MPFRTRHTTTTTHTAPRRSLFGRRHPHTTVGTTTRGTHRKGGLFSSRPRRTRRTAAPVTVTHHQKRRTSIGDKISGALLKLKGTVTGRPGQKAAGTRRMHGTDGRGRRRRFF